MNNEIEPKLKQQLFRLISIHLQGFWRSEVQRVGAIHELPLLSGKCLLWLLTTTALLLSPNIVQAQTYTPSNRLPVEDASLGTKVNSTGDNNFNIDGGLRRGQNLFHSFSDFSVPTGGAANFTNPQGNQSIITRVTGNVFSDINGTLNTNGANFLLINPNGVVFGTGAKLNVGKAFVTSTASGVNLVDGSGRSIVFGINPNGDAPLLEIDPNIFFNVSSLTMGGGNGQINNFGTLQTNNDSQYIGLIGGNVSLNGGKIIAPGGRVDIGGLNTNGMVNANSEGLVFNGTNLIRSDVSISNGSSVSVRANTTLNPVDPIFFPGAISPGSSINISANRIDLSNSGNRFLGGTNQALGGLDAGLEVNSGIKTGTIGNINLNATGDINIQRAAIFNLVRSRSQGTGGAIKIKGNNITVTDKSEISTNLSQAATGSGGNIDIEAEGNFSLFEPATSPAAKNIILEPSTPESIVTASTDGRGNSGKVKLVAKGNVLVSDTNTISSQVRSNGAGDSLGIWIEANSFELRNGGRILTNAAASNTNPTGNAGDIYIKTNKDITIFGSKDLSVLKTVGAINENRQNRGRPLAKIDSNNFRQGNSGKVTLIAPGKLSVVNRGAIWSQIRQNGVGNSGGISLNIGEMLLSNLSEISSSVGTYYQSDSDRPKGNPGNIDIQATGNITINEDRIVESVEVNNFSPSVIFNNLFGTQIGDLPAGKITIAATTADLPPKYAPPAIGWVFEKNGRVRLIAAQTAGGEMGKRIICQGK